MYKKALADMLRSRRFWIWQLAGAVIYAIPVAIRLTTGNVALPLLPETQWIGYWIPGNMVEKILVNAFFPGAAGAIAGEIFYSNLQGTLSRREKYFARLRGALIWVALWSLFQFLGNMQDIRGSYGGNLFEYPMVYPINFLLASLSIFTPTVLYFIKNKLTGTYRKPNSSVISKV